MRYFQPKEYQYVSQYTPDMAAMDYQKGQDLLKQEDAFNTNLNDVKKKFTLSKGQYTSQRLVDEANNAISTNLNKITQDLYSNKISAREANNQITNVATYFNSDPGIQAIIADKSLTEKEKADVASGKLNPKNSLNTYGAPTWSMNEGKRVKEIDDINELTNKLSKLYNTIDPGDPIKVAQGALKGILEKSGSSTFIPGKDYRFEYRDVTGKPKEKLLVAIDEGGREISSVGISPTQIKTAITDLVKANRTTNPDQFWEWHNRNQSTDDEIVNQLVGSYPGSFKMTTDKTEDDKYQVISDGSSKKGKGGSEDNFKELAKTTITTVGNTLNFTDANGKELTIGNPIDLKSQVVNNKIKLDESVQTSTDKLNTVYGQGLFTINNDDNNHPYIQVDESKIPIDKKAVILNEVITKNKQLKQQQIQQINNENILIRVEDAMKADAAALGKTFKLEDVKVTIDQKQKSMLSALNDEVLDSGVYDRLLIEINNSNDPEKLIKKYNLGSTFNKNYNKYLSEVNPEYAKYNKLLTDQLKGVQYKDQLMVVLDDKPESQSLKQVMQRTLDDKGLREKLVNDVTVNQNTPRPNEIKSFWDAYDSDPEYKKTVDKSINNGFARFDENTGKWATHITVPNKDGSKGNFELTIQMPQAQSLLQTYGADHGYDYNFIAMTKRKDWLDSFSSNEAGYGLLKSNKFIDKDMDENPDLMYDNNGNPIIDQRTGETKIQPSQGLDIITQRITVPRTYKDSFGNNQKLQVGEIIFELPGAKDVIFKSSDTNGLFRFHALLDAAKASGDVQLYNQTLNSATSYGIELINNPALYRDYSRQRRLTLDENSFKPSNAEQVQTKKEDPKVQAAQEEVNKYETIIKRKQETGRSGSVLTDNELNQKLIEAKENLEKAKLGK